MTGKEDNVGFLATGSGVQQFQPSLRGCFVPPPANRLAPSTPATVGHSTLHLSPAQTPINQFVRPRLLPSTALPARQLSKASGWTRRDSPVRANTASGGLHGTGDGGYD